jgi:hypothetical protein
MQFYVILIKKCKRDLVILVIVNFILKPEDGFVTAETM